MQDVKSILEQLIAQLDISDRYADQDNATRVPSVWQIQNGHLRSLAKDAIDSATSRFT